MLSMGSTRRKFGVGTNVAYRIERGLEAWEKPWVSSMILSSSVSLAVKQVRHGPSGNRR